MQENLGSPQKNTWRERFTSSFARWTNSDARGRRRYLLEPVDQEVKLNWQVMADTVKTWQDLLANEVSAEEREYKKAALRDAIEDHEIFLPVFRAIVNQEMERIFHYFLMVSNKCQSPIEKIMLYALIIAGREETQTCIADGYLFGEQHGYSTLYIEPQAKVENYRLDFLLTLEERSLRNQDEVVACPKIAVECDGHDFHNRTREQARHDRERDRQVQAAGLRIYRYTGSEIWADVFKCAHEIIRTLTRDAYQERR